MIQLYRARVNRKGEITIPKQLRTQFGIKEGTIIEFSSENDKIILRPLPRLEPGEPVGEEEFKKIIAELDEGRRHWR